MSIDHPVPLAQTLFVGLGATAVIDLWAMLRRRLFGAPALDYALVGRWLLYLPEGRCAHAPITASAPKAYEAAIGWSAHYLIGMLFALALVTLAGPAWLEAPRLLPALAVGLASVVFPFFVMQPGMGLGVAASRAPRPWLARGHSLVLHAVFGLAMYATALALQGFAA
ncbi:DUF2938 domain-containing protein [Comamonas guangdongensis]|uniref:DUF2938 domain-containing protein n=1 Tax=Comamonas guangdongensis TaxID=510515 RepID=A0ABV3ZYN5_9BURK